jgi:hypothetical protein
MTYAELAELRVDDRINYLEQGSGRRYRLRVIVRASDVDSNGDPLSGPIERHSVRITARSVAPGEGGFQITWFAWEGEPAMRIA